jgi:hypothetical protein
MARAHAGRHVAPLVLAGLAALTSTPAGAADAPALLRFRIRPGAVIDLGWTGLAHGQPWPADQHLVFAVDCGTDGTGPCTLSGGAPGDVFGAPVPLSAGGVSACVVNRLRAPVSGTIDAGTGCGEIHLALTATVTLAQDVGRPCALCTGDTTAHDGRKDGRCSDGPRAGKPCEAESTSALFGGATSNDCPAPGADVGALALDLTLTTGKATRTAETRCASTLLPGACFCEGQLQPTACLSATCPADERCATGPYDGACSGQPFRGCMMGSGTAECADVAPGAGSCETRVRSCFDQTITAEGVCSPTAPTYVAAFCAAATRAASINASAGLPGPARLVLPLERLPEPAAAPASGAPGRPTPRAAAPPSGDR